MSRNLQLIASTGLIGALAACGGGGGAEVESGRGATELRPTVYTSEGRLLNSCSLDPACSGNPYAPFFAGVAQAPAAGATISGVVRLEVRGNELRNVELLPASGYTPRYGVFNITGDGTIAWLDLDTRALPNGPLNLRISAFDSAAGQPGREIVAMPARTWNVSNDAASSAPLAAAVTVAPADGATVSGTTRLEIRGSGIANAELLPAGGYSPRLGVFNVSADRTMAWLEFDSRTLPDGLTGVRINAYDRTQGQPGATEVVAMPARNWNISNGSTASFSANATMAPGHGAVVSGTTRLEVRGSGLQNVELLPASGYLPRYGVFNISGDRTFAWLDFDSTSLPNALLDVRISAFSAPAGQPASEIVAMPPRQWDLRD